MADEQKPPAPKARARSNSVAVDDGKTVPGRAVARKEAASEPPIAGPAQEAKEEPAKPFKPVSTEPGDLPEAVRKRYYSDRAKWSGEPAFYTSAEVKDPAFRDQGRRLVTATESREVVKDLVAIAQHRSWDRIHVTGTEAFRRAVWLEAAQKGLEVRGYKPGDRDLQELDRLRADASRNTIAPMIGRDVAESRNPEAPRRATDTPRAAPGADRRGAARSMPNNRAAESQMRVMEAVIRRTLFDDPEGVARVMKVARAQLDAHIAAGHTIRPAMVRDADQSRRIAVAAPAARARAPADRVGREPKPQERVRSR